MRIGASLFLIAVGAILKWAVSEQVNGVNLATVGIILMVVGAIGLVMTLIVISTRRRTEIVRHDVDGRHGTTYVRPSEPLDGPY